MTGIRHGESMVNTRSRKLLVGVGVNTLLTAVLAEIIPRPTLHADDSLSIWPPGMERVLRPLPGVMPGIDEDSRFAVNSDGLRGDELLPEHSRRILAVCGSTTECLCLDREESWPYLVHRPHSITMETNPSGSGMPA